jgi:hypothetical protein
LSAYNTLVDQTIPSIDKGHHTWNNEEVMPDDGVGYNDDELHHSCSTWHTAPLEGTLLDEKWGFVVDRCDKLMD